MPLPPPAEALALLKAGVRALPAYTLDSSHCARKLNQNESPDDLPAALKQRIVAAVESAPWHRYPAFVPHALLERLADHYGWIPEGILVGNGSNELIQAVLAVMLEPGDRVLAPAPTFSLYRLLTGVLGGRYEPVPLGEGFTYQADALVDRARRTGAKAVILCSPNNPTGSVYPDGTVERLLAETEALILCDEAYQEFGGPSAIPLLGRSARVVVLRTFSKAFGLAGLRFGCALAHPALVQELAKGKLPYNVNLMTLTAAGVALEEPLVLQQRVAAVRRNRAWAIADWRSLPGLEVFPSEANFILVRSHGPPAPEMFRRLRDECDILVRDVSGVPGLAECLRVSVGTAEDMAAVSAAWRTILGAA